MRVIHRRRTEPGVQSNESPREATRHWLEAPKGFGDGKKERGVDEKSKF